MRFVASLPVGFAYVLLVSVGCSSSNDMINPPVADAACSNLPGHGDRFVDCGNGTVTDTQTHLIWLKNANCFGHEAWDPAMASAASLKSGDCGLTDNSSEGNWHLPSLQCPSDVSCNLSSATGEFSSLFGSACSSAPYVLNTAGTGCWTYGDPFSGVQSTLYWGSTARAGDPSRAWYVTLNNGYVIYNDKSVSLYVWPVRGGQ